jgi:cryptochrome
MVNHIRGFMNFEGKIVIGLEKDYQPYEKIRDSTITQWAKTANVHLEFSTMQTLWNLDLLEKTNGYKTCNSMAEFRKLIEQVGEPSPDTPAPTTLPPPPKELFLGKIIGNPTSCYFGKTQFFEKIPTFKELEMKYDESEVSSEFKGGETVSLKRLEMFNRNIQNITRYNRNNQNPVSKSPKISTQSPYLALGCLSVRKYYHSLCSAKRFFKDPESEDREKTMKKQKSVEQLIDSVLWREYFYMTGCFTQNFDQMYDNPISKLTNCWEYKPKYIRAWCEGRTGYPVIDAMMNQLRREGWTHQFSRQVLGCFLTKGFLWQTWEVGLNHFQKHSIDFDWSINTANWIWLSNTEDHHQNLQVRLISCITLRSTSRTLTRRGTSSASTSRNSRTFLKNSSTSRGEPL